MSVEGQPATERISVSISTLRYELGTLELRLVDRLNDALAHKADRQVQDQLQSSVSDAIVRIQNLEQAAVKNDSPLAQKVLSHDKEIDNLRAIAGYRKWLWAQTIALIAIAAPLAAFLLEQAIK